MTTIKDSVVEPAVVARVRDDLIAAVAAHEWPDPAVRQRATLDLLVRVAEVEHHGDDAAYVMEAWARACEFMSPLVLQARADMALLRRKTSRTIH